MNKKRLVIDIDEADHKNLVQTARALDLNVSNYVRQSLGLPVQQQGVKSSTPKTQPKKKLAGKKKAAPKKKTAAAKAKGK